ncbi:MAG: transketolase [Nitrospirae bacterium]|nr:transketolase [Nitrospirota bacterium]
MVDNLRDIAHRIRQQTFETICNGGGGHIPASLSIVEILTVLYYGGCLNVDPENPSDPNRDRFILSKGHACVSLYAALAMKGFFDAEELHKFGKRGSILGGHPDMRKVPGIEASTGALGHGLPFGIGVAMAAKLNRASYKVFVLIGDGECQEGSIWEAAMSAPQFKLDNLVVIVDYNKMQAMDFLDNIIPLEPLVDKWKAFNWEVIEADGHDMEKLIEIFNSTPKVTGKPTLIIAHTIKGKGVSFMENVPIWHFRMPNETEMKTAKIELGLI